MIRTSIVALAIALGFAQTAGAELLARISIVPTDLVGTPITSIAVGEDFQLQAIVQDLRDPPPALGSGVFAAYLNATYDAGLMSLTGGGVIEYTPFFTLVPTGNLSTPGQILGAGAATTSGAPPGNAPQFLWDVALRATNPGTASFTPSFDSLPGHDVLLFGKDEILLESEIDFVGSTLTIVPEPSTLLLGAMSVLGLIACAVRRRRGGAA